MDKFKVGDKVILRCAEPEHNGKVCFVKNLQDSPTGHRYALAESMDKKAFYGATEDQLSYATSLHKFLEGVDDEV